MTERERDASAVFAEGLELLLKRVIGTLIVTFREDMTPRRPAPEAPTPDRPALCLESEGATGVHCQLAEGHALPHDGWHRPDGDEKGEYAILVRWPAPDRPDFLGGVPNSVACAHCGDPIERARRTFHGNEWEHYWTGWPSCAGNATTATLPYGWPS